MNTCRFHFHPPVAGTFIFGVCLTNKGWEKMGFSNEDLNDIYDKNDGYCWHCGKKLAFANYGMVGQKGAWEVDHSNPQGVDDLRNWVPSCISCNRSKQDLTTRQFSG
jgi:hypothetical protein